SSAASSGAASAPRRAARWLGCRPPARSPARLPYTLRMKSLWNEAEAAATSGDLGARVYSSRLLGRDRSLVLHGGGNTSVKVRETALHGADEEILYVKGSGWDLDSIEAAGFAPVRLAPARRLAELLRLSDAQMVNELATSLKRAGA